MKRGIALGKYLDIIGAPAKVGVNSSYVFTMVDENDLMDELEIPDTEEDDDMGVGDDDDDSSSDDDDE